MRRRSKASETPTDPVPSSAVAEPRAVIEASGGRGGGASPPVPAPAGPEPPPAPARTSHAPPARPFREPAIAPASPLFRARALARYQVREGVAEVLEVGGPIAWALFLGTAALVLAGLVVALVARVEVVSRARGVMRPLDGIVAIAAQSEGLVAEVLAHAGQDLVQGQPLLRVDSAEIGAQLLAAQRQIEVADEQLAEFERQRKKLHGAALVLLERRARLAERQIDSQREHLGRVQERVDVAARLDARGVVARREVDVLHDELSAGQRTVLGLQSELAASRLESNRLEREREALARDWLGRKRLAEAQLEGARLLLARTEVRAPFDGTLESLLVRPGAQVSPATPVGRIIPKALSDRVVVFAPERDRAFIRPGARVRMAVDQLPSGEFGWLSGRVARVARAVATPEEIRDVLGAELTANVTYFRVEVTLADDENRRKLSPHLRTGALLTAQIVMRTQRVVALLLRPLKELLEP
jgi:multidrug resistance efflux pump